MELHRILIVCIVMTFYETRAFPNSIQKENSNEIYEIAERKDKEEGTQKKIAKNVKSSEEQLFKVQSLEDSPYKCNPPIGPPLPPENGYVIGQNYDLGATLEVRCNNGYVINGSSTVHCIAVPNPWKHQVMWDSLFGPLPKCIEQSQQLGNAEGDTITGTVLPPPPPPLTSQGGASGDEPVKDVKEKNDRCYTALNSGICIDYQQIYYFDQNDGECKPANVCAPNVSDYFISSDICQFHCLDPV